jgi:hypothetical protein
MIDYLISLFNKLRNKNNSKLLKLKIIDSNPVKPDSVVILVPVSNSIEPAVDESLRKLESMGYTVWRRYGWSAIDQGRCAMAQEALDKGFEHLFWIDADVAFWPYDVEKVIKSGLPFVSAPYSVKGWPALTTEFIDKKVVLGEKGGLYEVVYAATGFMYTHRSVYDAIVKNENMTKVKIWGGQYQVYPYFYPLLLNDEYIGEDFAFCHRIRSAGIKLYCDTRIKLAHIGKYSYSFGFLENGVTKEPTSVIYTKVDNNTYS